VSKQLGHKDASITLKVYAHWLPQASQAHLVDRLDDAPRNATQTPPAALDGRDQIALSALRSVVSRVGIAPERRSRRLKPECLRITGRDHVERGETW